jgi:hypothetical protein
LSALMSADKTHKGGFTRGRYRFHGSEPILRESWAGLPGPEELCEILTTAAGMTTSVDVPVQGEVYQLPEIT